MKMKKFKEIIFLKNLKGVGKKTIYKDYWEKLNDADDFYDLVSEVELNGKFSVDEIKQSILAAEQLYDYISTSDIEVITVFDDEYPKQLEIMDNDRPLILYIKGNTEILKRPNIAIIGTRKPLKFSVVFETNLVKSILDSSDRVIISGLALGCDKIAHKTTVDENKPTIAILPSGVNVIKPAKHKKLAQEIIDTGGCLISEYEPNKTPYKQEYIDRDKIVAAFSDATFVVECGVKSGTMHTVNFASDYKKQIYAYLPSERPKESYDGNEFILAQNNDAVKVEDTEKFLSNLEDLKNKKKKVSFQQTLI